MRNVIALGFFDSLHIGHRVIIEEGKKIAEKNGEQFALATFGDGFLTALGRREEEIFLLEERKEILRELGVNNIIILPQDRDFLSNGKAKFLEHLSLLNPCALICGSDYRFGKKAEGTVFDLQSFFLSKGIEVKIIDLLCIEGEKVSSRDIRDYLKKGDVEIAEKLLGRRFFYEGMVKKGRKDGRKIGFPTINIDIPCEKIKIKSGVYVTVTLAEGKEYLSVTNVGTHPTFDDGRFNTETHIIGNPGDLYDKKVRVEFLKYIREISKFSDKKALADRISKDVEYAKEVIR